MIERNHNPAGRLLNILFGFAQTFDGLVRVFSLGFLHTRAAVSVSHLQMKILIAREKAKRSQ